MQIKFRCLLTLLFSLAFLPISSLVIAQDATSESPGLAKGIGLKRAFPNLRFDRPVFLTGCGDQSGRLFVVEQAGVIRVFESRGQEEDVKTSEVFLDIHQQVSRRGNEEGLIGIAFHPDFKNNGQLFVHYSSAKERQTNYLSRFQLHPDDPNRIDVESEKVLLRVKQPFSNHNGGSIEFGPDGFLYISLGDGGSARDPHGNGQNLETLLGSILRIDVDHKDEGLDYSIPEDNPFVDVENARPEIWALGLRNVWRFSFDRKTGDLWAADVGQDKIEEVSIVKRGGNYGWNRYEANADFKVDTVLAVEPHQPPVATYGREWGISITGGYVYRGKRFPDLIGSYFYGDYVSGNLWRCRPEENGEYRNELVRRTGRSIASFGEDDNGELFLVSFDGGIYRVVPTAEPENTFADWPAKLSDTGLYASTASQEVSPKLIPYEVNAPFWSDGAEKSRYISLPDAGKLQYSENETWVVPVGTTIVKNFKQVGGRPSMLETRLIKRTAEGWESATYVWNPNGRDAELLPNGKQYEVWNRPQRRGQPWQVDSWHAPSASECSSCHVDAAGYVLGLRTAQLNLENEEGKNQIVEWAKQGVVELPEDFEVTHASKFGSADSEKHELGHRARVWLDVNCAMCHRPDGPGNASIDLRFETKLDAMKMVGEKPAQGDQGIRDALLIAPGNPQQSLLLQRVATLGPGRMPNIGSNRVDEKAVELLREWIKSLE